jgi:hypothetical protein
MHIDMSALTLPSSQPCVYRADLRFEIATPPRPLSSLLIPSSIPHYHPQPSNTIPSSKTKPRSNLTIPPPRRPPSRLLGTNPLLNTLERPAALLGQSARQQVFARRRHALRACACGRGWSWRRERDGVREAAECPGLERNLGCVRCSHVLVCIHLLVVILCLCLSARCTAARLVLGLSPGLVLGLD